MVGGVIGSLGAPMIPGVAREMHVAVDTAQWSLTAALLTGAVAAPVLGRLGDGAHPRATFLGALAIVFAGSVVAGLAPSLPVLVAGRAMQGVALGLAPLTMATARSHLPPERATAVIGVLSVTTAVGAALSFPISGLVAQELGLRAAYLTGALMSGIALAAAFATVPSDRGRRHLPLDGRGVAFLASGLVALLVAVGQGARWGWGSTIVLTLFAVAVVVLTVTVRGLLGREDPLIDLRQFRHRAVLTADIAALSLGVAMYIALTSITEFVQAPTSAGYGFGASTTVAGLVVVPLGVFGLVTSRSATSVTRRFGGPAVLTVGTLLIGVANLFFAVEHSALWEAFVAMALLGIGFGYTFAVIPTLIGQAVPARDTGSAMGLYQVIRFVGFSIGSAAVASILASHTPSGAALPTARGYVVALSGAAAVCLASAALSWRLGGGRPDAAAIPVSERDRLARDDAELATAGLVGSEAGSAR